MDTKAVKIFVLLGLFFLQQFCLAQSPSDFFKAVGTSNYSLLESYLGTELDVCISEVQQVNKRSVAMNRLKTFLDANAVQKIEPLHNGSSKTNVSEYKLAKLHTNNGIFRLFVYSESEGGRTFVKEIRIEKM